VNAWLILGALISGVVAGGLFEHNRMSANAEKEALELQAKVDEYKTNIGLMSDQIATAYSTKQTETVVRYKTITKEAQNAKISNPSLDKCTLPNDWVHVYNRANGLE
jgi:hypothetical protein